MAAIDDKRQKDGSRGVGRFQPPGPVGTSPKQSGWYLARPCHDVQLGDKHPAAKPLRGFGGAGVLEVVEDEAGSTYRAVYTVKFASVVYVLHAFQKKSKRGIKTPPHEVEKVRNRLKEAEKHYAQRKERQESKQQE